MPPRRSACVACAFSSLPIALVAAVFAKLPVKSRLRCAEVCKAWRAALSEPGLWTRVNLRDTDATDALVLAATARAAGKLRALDLTDCPRVTHDTLLAVLRANAGALRELRVSNDENEKDDAELRAVLLVAPQLTTLEASTCCRSLAEASLQLRQQPPFVLLRVKRLVVWPLAPHVAANERRLSSVSLVGRNLTPAIMPHLVRLLDNTALRELRLAGSEIFDAASAALFGAALAESTTIGALSLNLWAQPAAATALLRAVTGHQHLDMLVLSGNELPRHPPSAAAALGALIAANSPALLMLDVSDCGLDNTRMRPLLDALRSNTHLRMLRCRGCALTPAFTREVLLPAVRECTSLASLNTGLTCPGARAAEALARSRAAA